MVQFLCICLGGALGTGARFLLIGWVQRLWPGPLPMGTIGVNALGSLILGLLTWIAVAWPDQPPTLRLSLTTGLMGGFTTYSTFNQETLGYLHKGDWLLALTNVLLTLIVCLLAGALGMLLGRQLLPAR